MQVRSGASRDDVYDTVTIAFHWAVAIMVLCQFALALVPGVVKSSISLHKGLGLILLVLVVLRIVWRLFFGRRTGTSADAPLLLRLAAKAGHFGLYGLLIVTPILGWLYLDARAMDVHVLGLELPMLLYYDRDLANWIYGWKKVAAYSLLALIFVHAGAAIVYHARLRRDRVLHSMLPARYRGDAALS
jgi:cytochrome b561